MKHAVNAEPDAHLLLLRFDVNVGGPVGDRLGHDRRDQLDDRRVLDRRLDLSDPIIAALHVRRRFLDHVVELSVERGELADRLLHVARGRHDGLHVAVGDRADVVEGVDVRGVGHGDEQLVVPHADRDRPVASRQRLGEQRGRHRIDLEVGQIDEFETHLLGEGAHEVGFLDEALVDQDAPERLRRLPVLVERRLELFLREEPLLDQDLTELLGLALRQSPPLTMARSLAVPAWLVPVAALCLSSSPDYLGLFVINAGLLKEPGELLCKQHAIDLGIVVGCGRRGRGAVAASTGSVPVRASVQMPER